MKDRCVICGSLFEHNRRVVTCSPECRRKRILELRKKRWPYVYARLGEKLRAYQKHYRTVHADRKRDQDKAYKLANLDKIREMNHKRYIAKRDIILARHRALYIPHPRRRMTPEEQRARRKVQRKENFERTHSKSREACAIFGRYGTTVVDAKTRKMVALLHLGYRLTKNSRSSPIEIKRVPSILNQIKKGVTHVAYAN